MFDCLIISQVKSLSQDKWRSVVHHVWVDSEQKYVTPIGTTRMLKLCAGNLDYHMVGTQDSESDNSNSVQQPNHDCIALHCILLSLYTYTANARSIISGGGTVVTSYDNVNCVGTESRLVECQTPLNTASRVCAGYAGVLCQSEYCLCD